MGTREQCRLHTLRCQIFKTVRGNVSRYHRKEVKTVAPRNSNISIFNKSSVVLSNLWLNNWWKKLSHIHRDINIFRNVNDNLDAYLTTSVLGYSIGTSVSTVSVPCPIISKKLPTTNKNIFTNLNYVTNA